MRYGSVCSGVAPQTESWKALGLECAWFAEIEKFPAAVLAHHYPEIPNLGDFTEIGVEHGPIELLVGGTPCQDFSVAGLRAGMAGDRGNLTLQFLRLADRLRPKWLVWENVPGVMSSNKGRDFGAFLGGLGQLGYGWSYRTLDAQYFGVPQRRRRVFVVGCLGDWRLAAAVLFERHSLSGHPAPRREKGQGFTHDVAPCIGASGRGFERGGDTRGQDPVVAWPAEVAQTLDTHFGDKMGLEDQHIRGGQVSLCLTSHYAKGGDPQVDQLIEVPLTKHGGFFDEPISLQSVNTPREKKQNGLGVSEEGVMYSLTARDQHAIAFSAKDHGADAMEDCSPTLRAGGHTGSHANAGVMPAVAISANQRGELRAREAHGSLNGTKSGKQFDGIMQGMAVRRLTPRECERLQGFPDDWTLIPLPLKRRQTRVRWAADGPRYKAIGNSWAVPVLDWIAERIQQVEAVTRG